MKKISCLFIALAIILSDIMCAVIAYNYCYLHYFSQYVSAPESTAFIYSIPFGIAIALCAVLAWVFHRKTK